MILSLTARSDLSASCQCSDASTRATCNASRPVPSRICWRHEVPSATMMRVGVRLAHGRQQRELAHRQRDVDRVGAVAEAAGHAAAARLDGLDVRGREPAPARARHRSSRRTISDGNGRAASARLPTSPSVGANVPASASRARNSSNVSACSARCCARVASLIIAGISSRKPNMQLGSRPTTGTPRATNGASAASVRSASRRASSTLPTDRNVRPQHSGRPPSAGLGRCTAIAGRVEHRDRGLEILRLEVAVEGVGEQDDLAVATTSRPARRGKQSLRQRGSGRRALKPASISDAFAAPGSLSRRFRSHGTFAA